jgi:ribokinase
LREGDDPVLSVPTVRVEAVDTTAAGDAFTAALAVGLAEGRPMADAVRLGCAAGTLAVTRFGAQPAMPTRAEVDAFLHRLKGPT